MLRVAQQLTGIFWFNWSCIGYFCFVLVVLIFDFLDILDFYFGFWFFDSNSNPNGASSGNFNGNDNGNDNVNGNGS